MPKQSPLRAATRRSHSRRVGPQRQYGVKDVKGADAACPIMLQRTFERRSGVETELREFLSALLWFKPLQRRGGSSLKLDRHLRELTAKAESQVVAH